MTQQNVDRDSQANTPINGIAGRVVRSWLYIMPSGPTDLTFGHPAGRRVVKRLGACGVTSGGTDWGSHLGSGCSHRKRFRYPARHQLIKGESWQRKNTPR